MKLLFIGILLCLVTVSGYADSSGHILVQNLYFPKPGKEKEVYELRLYASNVIAKLGAPKGRVLKRKKISDRPYVMWECEYSSTKERKRAITIASQSAEFKHVEDRMEQLVNNFKRITWQIAE